MNRRHSQSSNATPQIADGEQPRKRRYWTFSAQRFTRSIVIRGIPDMAGPAAGLTWVVNDTQSRPDSPLVKTAQHQPGKHRAGEGPRPAV